MKLTSIENPTGWKADGADVALVQVEVVDSLGRRCPLADNPVKYTLRGEAEWRGGVAAASKDNYAGSTYMPVDAGINRVLLRSTLTAGKATLTAEAAGLPKASITLATKSVNSNGLSTYFPSDGLKGSLEKGETPAKPSFVAEKRGIEIMSAVAGSNQNDASNSYDGVEGTTWVSSSQMDKAWITYTLAEDTPVEEVCLKMGAFRSKAYPIEIYAGDELVWQGYTPKSLGYVRLPLQKKGIRAHTYTIRMVGSTDDGDAFGGVKEVDKRNDEKAVKGSTTLRIIEAEFITKI